MHEARFLVVVVVGSIVVANKAEPLIGSLMGPVVVSMGKFHVAIYNLGTPDDVIYRTHVESVVEGRFLLLLLRIVVEVVEVAVEIVVVAV